MPTRVRRRRAHELAQEYDGVPSRVLLRWCEVDHEMVRREIAAERWAAHGFQTVAMTTAPLGTTARRWQAVWETGVKVAALGGVRRVSLVGWRLIPDAYLDQICTTYWSRVGRRF